MARVIIRKSKVNLGSPQPNVIRTEKRPAESSGTFEFVTKPDAGEPDGTGRESAADDNEPSAGKPRNAKKFVDPATNSRPDRGGRTPAGNRGRGGPRGSSGKFTSRTRESETSKDLKSILLTIHFGLATLTKSPKLKLTEEEAALYADAAQRVMDLYEIEILSPEKRAWFNLLWVMGCIYVPRFGTKGAAAPSSSASSASSQDVGRVVTMPVAPVSSGVN